MDLDHKAPEALAKAAVWSEVSLGYAREHGQRNLVGLLEAVKADVEFEGALSSNPPSRTLPGPTRGGIRETQDNGRSSDAADREKKREREEAKHRARQVAWELFMKAELRELELRKDGELRRLLGDPQPGESPAALEKLAEEDRRQAREGLVALMSMGKISYKRLGELSPDDMSSRAAANRLRTTWLKERRDGWLPRRSSSRG